MDPVYEEPVETWPTDTLVLGKSSWHGGADRSLKYAWPDKNGKRARGGVSDVGRCYRQAGLLRPTDTVRGGRGSPLRFL
jgi:hypothetical protein